jgi:chromosome segregation ATPase
MALTQSQRNQIASYKIQIEGYRKNLQTLKDQKKRTSEDYANRIKNTKDANSKRSYIQSKISALNTIVNNIESKKKDIERIKEYIQRVKA